MCIAGVAIFLALGTSGCGERGESAGSGRAEKALGADVKPAERPYFDAGRPFLDAIAARDYRKAYDLLSSHAKARMSPSQFVAPENEATHNRNEAAAVRDVALEQFSEMMAATEKRYGKPSKLIELDVFSTDPAALSGKATAPEDKLESMFAIGMMPASIPAELRKASLRGKLLAELSPEQLDAAAKAQQTPPQTLQSDPDFQPYLNVKLVLVEDSGQLKIGYFEFLPPSILD